MTEAEKVKGKAVVNLLRCDAVVKAFADLTNPIDIQVIDNLGFLTPIDLHVIKNAYQEHGPTTGGATLRDCLIHRYNDNQELNVQQFIDGLDNIGHLQLKNVLLSLCNSSQGCIPGFVDDERLTKIAKNLAQHYKYRFAQYSPYPHADPFSISRVWVNLSLLKGRSEMSGDYLTMLKEAYDGPQFSLLIGHPGEGKTMTMRRIAYDWSTGKLTDYDLVLAVPLREIQENTDTILNMALTYMQSRNVLKEADVEHLKANRDSMVAKGKSGDEPSHQLHVLIVLDGYDEFHSSNKCQELDLLLFSRDLPNLDYCVLVTSRPYAVEDVSSPVSTLKIEPLDMEQQRTYMLQHFKQNNVDDDDDDDDDYTVYTMMEKLEALLLENSSLQELAKTPLLLCFICILCDVLKPTDDDVQLYKLIFNAMTERYESTVSSMRRLLRRSMRGIFKEPFYNICGKSELIYNLGQMALTGLAGETGLAPDKLQFTEDDLRNFGIDGDYCIKVGFLNFQLQERLNEKKYEFPHKTMQEFFAALLLFHELSKCKEIVLYREDKKDSTCPKIKNIDRLFRHHPLLNQVFKTTKYEELNQLFRFLLEMSADYCKNCDQSSTNPVPIDLPPLQRLFRRLTGSQETQSRRMSNAINFFLAWTGRNKNRTNSIDLMFRSLLKHLSNCSEEAKNYLCHELLFICDGDDSESLLLRLFTSNVPMCRVADVCIYIPDLQIIFIVDQTSIDRAILSHAIPISYEQLKTKCDGTFKLCMIDSAALENLHPMCKAIECKKIDKVNINISSAVNQSSSLSLKQKLQVDEVMINFDETSESPFDLSPVWNSCISLFTNITKIDMGSLREDSIQVIGLDLIFAQTDIRKSVKIIKLTDITFPNEETVSLLAEQLKQLKSLEQLIIFTCPSQSIGEQYLFMLLDSVKEVEGKEDEYLDYLHIADICLEQRETFEKLTSHLEQWDHLRSLRLNGFLSSDTDLLCKTVSKLSHLEQLHVKNLNEQDVNRLSEANPNLMVTNFCLSISYN